VKPSLALLIALSASSLFASGWISFTTTSRIGPAAYDQVAPVVASNGFDYLVAWTTNIPSGSAIYTVRVNANGTLESELARPLDPSPDVSPSSDKHPHAVSLTPGRDGYFLAWISDDGLNAAITDAFGAVERRQTVPQDNPKESSTLAAWNGAAYLVLSGFSGPFMATLFDNNGQVIRTNIPIGDTHLDFSHNALVADGTGFLVLSTKQTSEGTDLYGRRVNPSGVPGEWFLIRSMATNVIGIIATYDGSHDVIVWGDAFGLWTMHIDSQSNTTGPARQLFSANVDQLGGALWFDHRLRIGYQTRPDYKPQVIAVSSDGTMSPPVSFEGGFAPQLATNDTNLLSIRSVATQPNLTGWDVIGSFLSTAATTADFVVSKSAALQQNGELAFDGSNALAVWDETIPPERQIFASRIGASRSPADSAGVQISSSGINTNPAAAFNGMNHLIAWTRIDESGGAHTVARRFSPDGKVLDSADIVMGDGARGATPRVSTDGTNWLVVWSRSVLQSGCGGMAGSFRLFAARVSPDGVVLDPDGVAVDPDTSRRQVEPDVAWNGSKYVVTWKAFCQGFHNPSFSWIVAATMSPDLAHIEPSTITPDNAAANVEFSMPRVAVTADRTLVAWQRDYATIEYRVFGNTILHNPSRLRAVGARPPTPSFQGTLLGVMRDAAGRLLILSQATIPWATAYQGVFSSAVDNGGVAGNREFKFGLAMGERLMGRPMAHENNVWMPEARFTPTNGAERLYIREFN
jgi:hypothetical protein